MAKNKRTRNQATEKIQIQPPPLVSHKIHPSTLETLPQTYQQLTNYVESQGSFLPFELRLETFKRIEKVTGIPLICYVAKTENNIPGIPTFIDDSDLIGFDDLVKTTDGDIVDVFVISNGGSAEATERIVKLLRERYSKIRYLIPANAYSAATLMCLSGNEIVMAATSTLGPIDPQINGIPARAILRAFERVKEELKAEGPASLTAYMPLLSKYDLHIFEICRTAEQLSTELARAWLSHYMLECPEDDERVNRIVDHLISYDVNKSHARGIDRRKSRELGLNIVNVEEVDGLGSLLQSLRNQFAFWFDRTPFYKCFENSRGINWGRQAQDLIVQAQQNTPGPGRRQPGPPHPTR